MPIPPRVSAVALRTADLARATAFHVGLGWEFEADKAAQVLPDPGMAVMPIVAVRGTQVPWGKVVTDGVPVLPARRLPSILGALPAVLRPERVAVLADQARVRFRVAAWPRRSVPTGFASRRGRWWRGR